MNGKAIASNRFSASSATPKRNSAQTVRMISGIATTNTFIYKFSRPLAASGDSTVKTLKPGAINMIWAFSPTPVTDENSPTMHDKYGTVKVDLFSENAVVTGGGAGASPMSSFLTHGILMIVAWFVCTTAGIYVARFTKEDLGVWWFRLHWGLMLLGLLFTIVGFAVAVAAKPSRHFSGFHEALGLVVFLLSIVQTILGQVINVMFNPYRTGIPWYDRLHWYQGRLLYGMAVVNVFCGIVQYTGGDKTRLALFVVAGLLFVGGLVAFGYGSYRYGGQTHHTNAPKRRASENSLSEFTPPSKLESIPRSPPVNSNQTRPGYGDGNASPVDPPAGYSMNRPGMRVY